MSDRTCSSCGKSFTFPAALRRHLKRKTPCAPILDLDGARDPEVEKLRCHFCNRVYASNVTLQRHVRHSCKIAPNAANGEAGMEKLYKHTLKSQQAEIVALKLQNVEIMKLMEEMRESRASGAHNNNCAEDVGIAGDNAVVNYQKDNRTINISIFGQESLGHITTDHIREILNDSVRIDSLPDAANEAILKAAMMVYSDPSHPENITCYLPNKKTNDALVHTGQGKTGWEVQPVTLVWPRMTKKSFDALFDNQPFEDAYEYEDLLRHMRDNEEKLSRGRRLRPILVRNKTLLNQALAECGSSVALRIAAAEEADGARAGETSQ